MDDKDRLWLLAEMPFHPSLIVDARSEDKLVKIRAEDNNASLYQFFLLPTNSNVKKYSWFEYDLDERKMLHLAFF